MDLLRFLNRLVVNAKFNVEDVCNVYRRLKIDGGDDSDTVSYIGFMAAIMPKGGDGNTGSTMANTGCSPSKFNTTIEVGGSLTKRGISMPHSGMGTAQQT